MKDTYPFSSDSTVVDADLIEWYNTFSDGHLEDILNSSLINADYHIMRARICEFILRSRSSYGRDLRADDDESE